jgi:hypothetical protein
MYYRNMCPNGLRTATALRQESRCPGAHIRNEYVRNRYFNPAGSVSTLGSVKSHISDVIIVHSVLVSALHATVT